MPNQANLGRQAVIFTVILLISIGLCGYTALPGHGEDLGVGFFGLAGIGIGGIGLLVTGIRALVRK